MKRDHLAVYLAGLLCAFAECASGSAVVVVNDGAAKQAIINFVREATREGDDFVRPEDRIAVFDNDGTLWPEQPVVQVMFSKARLRELAAKDPSMKTKQPFQAALEGDISYFKNAGEPAVMRLFAATHANLTQEQFDSEVSTLFKTAQHPKFKVPYTQLAYRPMVELLEYLRSNGFQTWICSGGGIDFIRAISMQMYGIPPQQVIGSSLKKQFLQKNGKFVLWRTAEVQSISDKEGKPPNINLHIGKRPRFGAGNVRSGGDIAMLRYTQSGSGRSLQIMINHDDAEREFAYQEKDGASLRGAQENNWIVLSMKRDWKVVFAPAATPQTAARK